MLEFYEFFAGGGMARAGLGPQWTCTFANDFDPMKAKVYSANWGSKNLLVCDVAHVENSQLPGEADLAWASFPCQDLSLAGDRAGLDGDRSGTFWPFWRLIEELLDEQRGPKTIVLENVCGTITSHGGRDFEAIAMALTRSGYRFGALVADAKRWVPQSRPRLFVIGIRSDIAIPAFLRGNPNPEWHPNNLIIAKDLLPLEAQRRWFWWNLPTPPPRKLSFIDILEDEPKDVQWHSTAQTNKLLSLMNELNRDKLNQMLKWTRKNGTKAVGGVYRRTRNGQQRAEVRFDDLSGCLRTPSGGSSRQTVIVVDNGRVRSRLLSSREAARLMGLPDSYKLPSNYNQAYHICGDGVAVPAVRFLAEQILEPILMSPESRPRIIAV